MIRAGSVYGARTVGATMTEALRRVPYFASLAEAQIQQIARHVRTRSYETGDVILVEGRPCEGLYFVIRGHVRLWHAGPDGREQVLRILGPGRPFNDVAVFDEGANPDNVTAAGACVVGSIPRKIVRTLVEQHPEVATAALRLLAARQRSLGHVVEDLARRDVVARVARLLLGCAGRHEHIVEGAPEACARITHEEIAAMVGSVREVVQRALKELERAGAIRLERARIHILDLDALSRWSNLDERGRD
jgi:CRP-like cAMP-binding protein